MTTLRLARPDDLDALYHICLKTGDFGQDASPLHDDPKVIGHIYAGPYLVLQPELAVVAEQDGVVVGYCIGARDTLAFADRMERDWWPALRAQYPCPDPAKRADWTADQTRAWTIHNPELSPKEAYGAFPAHVHMNLLPQAQGQGLGHRLLGFWFEQARVQGLRAVHLGANAENHRAVAFWAKNGFERIETPQSRSVWMGQKL